MELPKRKDLRMKKYYFSENGHYFVTVCTAERKETLSSIMVGEGLAPPEVKLTSLGKIAEEQIGALNERYGNVTAENYVIMPDHIHLLLFIDGFDAGGASPSPTLSDIICSFKSLTKKKSKEKGLCNKTIWQRSFYDHIIRDERDYAKHYDYTDNNPALWLLDKDEEI